MSGILMELSMGVSDHVTEEGTVLDKFLFSEEKC